MSPMPSGCVACEHRDVTTDRPPFERGGDDALVAGVASGLARHLGTDALKVRIVFGLLTISGGAGILLYGAFWLVVPRRAGEAPTATADKLQLPAIGALVVGG